MKIDEKILNGRQYRNMQLDAKEDEKECRVEGYATTFDQPYLLYSNEYMELWEKVDKKAFDKTDMSDTIMQYDHEGRVYARVSNKTLELTVDEHGLLVRADLSGTEEGRKLYEEIKGGYTSKMSFGFTVTGEEMNEENRKGEKTKYTRTITEIGKLYDVSAVSLPANDATEISARSFINGVIEKDKTERLMREETEEKRKLLALKIKLMEGDLNNGN